MMHSRLSRQAIAWRESEAARREVAAPLHLQMPAPGDGATASETADTGPAEVDFGAEAGGHTIWPAPDIDDDFY